MTGPEAAEEIRQLASGTIATLTGLKTYREIDAKRESNAVCVEYAVRPFDHWMDAWNWIEKQNNTVCGIHNEY